VAFDRCRKLDIKGSTVISDAGLPAFRELDDALGPNAMAEGTGRHQDRHDGDCGFSSGKVRSYLHLDRHKEKTKENKDKEGNTFERCRQGCSKVQIYTLFEFEQIVYCEISPATGSGAGG
jgi:hypothetical protein